MSTDEARARYEGQREVERLISAGCLVFGADWEIYIHPECNHLDRNS